MSFRMWRSNCLPPSHPPLSYWQTMPFFDPKELFGWNMDRHLLLQSTPQPLRYASKCCVYERDYVECADALTLTRAKKECLHEWEDLMECMHRKKTVSKHMKSRGFNSFWRGGDVFESVLCVLKMEMCLKAGEGNTQKFKAGCKI